MRLFIKSTINTYFSTHSVWVMNPALSEADRKAAWSLVRRGKHPVTHNDGEPDYARRFRLAESGQDSLKTIKELAIARQDRNKRCEKAAAMMGRDPSWYEGYRPLPKG